MKNRLINLAMFFLITIQIAWYGLLVAHLISNPTILREGYYTIYPAGYIARYWGFSHTYDLNLQQQVEAEANTPSSLMRFYPYAHPPFLLPIMSWVTTTAYTASFYKWISVLVVFHLLSLLLLARLLRSSGWQRKEVWFITICGLVFYPVFIAYVKGEDSTFTLFGVALWTYGLLTKKDKLAGLGLVLAAMRPQIALVLAIPFLFKRRQVWWGFVSFGLIALLYSYLLVGMQGMKGFVQAILLTGEGKGINVEVMPTLMGSLMRAFPTISAQWLHAAGYSAYGAAILFLCLIWLKSREIRFNHIGLAVLISIVFSPHLHLHDLSLLLVPMTGAAVILVERALLSPRNAVFVILGITLVFTLNGVFLSYISIYLMFILLGLLLWVPGWWKASLEENPKVP